MYDLMVLRPGGGWATDTTGSLARVTTRARDLKASNRRRVVFRVYDHTGRKVNI